MDRASTASELLNGTARPLMQLPSDPQKQLKSAAAAASQGSPSSAKSARGPPSAMSGVSGGESSLFIRIATKSFSKKSGEQQRLVGRSSRGRGSNLSPSVEEPTAGGSLPSSPAAHGRPQTSAELAVAGPSSLPTTPLGAGQQQRASSPSVSGGRPSFVPKGETIYENSVPGAGAGPRPVAATGQRSAMCSSPLAAPLGLQSPGGGGRLPPPPGSVSTAKYAVVDFDAASGQITTTGDIPHPGLAMDVWGTVSVCRSILASSSVAVSAPPRHSRLCMTIQQIERLSATRSQREGGQRLGSADAQPWQYHPEVAGLSSTQQVTRRLECARGLLGPRAPAWYVTACRPSADREVFVVHSDDVDEAAVIRGVLGQVSGSMTFTSIAGQQAPRQTRDSDKLSSDRPALSSKPGAARHLILSL